MSIILFVKVTLLSFPLKRPFSNHSHPLTEVHGINVSVETKDNTGTSFIYSLHRTPRTNVVKNIEKDIVPSLFKIEEDTDIKSKWNTIWSDYKKDNLEEEKLFALAAVDIAMWDLFTKQEDISLHKYLGGAHEKMRVYATTGWLSLSEDELISECYSYEKKGITAFKVRLGHENDFSRVKRLREEMGEKYILMADINRRYTAEKSGEISKNLSQFNLDWIEEPTFYEPCDLEKSHSELKKIKETSEIPVALGENILEEKEFKKVCENKWTDYLQPDLPRCGGITGFKQAAEIALKNKIALCSHLMPQLSASLVTAYENGAWVEYDNLLPEGIFIHDIPVIDGFMEAPSIPGTGVELTKEALKKYGTTSYEFNK